jgi:hypothetical protein
MITISAKRAAKDSTAWSNAPLDHDLTTLPVYTQKFFTPPVTTGGSGAFLQIT